MTHILHNKVKAAEVMQLTKFTDSITLKIH